MLRISAYRSGGRIKFRLFTCVIYTFPSLFKLSNAPEAIYTAEVVEPRVPLRNIIPLQLGGGSKIKEKHTFVCVLHWEERAEILKRPIN